MHIAYEMVVCLQFVYCTVLAGEDLHPNNPISLTHKTHLQLRRKTLRNAQTAHVRQSVSFSSSRFTSPSSEFLLMESSFLNSFPGTKSAQISDPTEGWWRSHPVPM